MAFFIIVFLSCHLYRTVHADKTVRNLYKLSTESVLLCEHSQKPIASCNEPGHCLRCQWSVGKNRKIV